jgi:type I restriction enzyme S subunit
LSVYREYGVVPKDSRDDNHNVTSEDTSKYKYVRPNDFVINKMKAWQGSMGVSDHEGIVSPAYFVYGFSDDDYNPRYFHYFMRNANNIPEYRRLSGGIREGQWDLSPYDLGNMPVIVPPKAEQNEIVAFLDEKCAAIEQSIADKQTQIETLKAYKSSLIYEYVTGKKQVI